MPRTDGERVVADLKRLADFGRYKTGVHRPTYSPEDIASRQWLADKFAEAGLDPVIDGIGNVIGRNPRASRRLLVGSHSETQPHGGWLARWLKQRNERALSWVLDNPRMVFMTAGAAVIVAAASVPTKPMTLPTLWPRVVSARSRRTSLRMIPVAAVARLTAAPRVIPVTA
jgi:hypothetical protein